VSGIKTLREYVTTPGLKRCLVSMAAESNVGRSCSTQRISWQAVSRERGIPARSSSEYELERCCRVQLVWPRLTLRKSYIRFASKPTPLDKKAS
jgi:hypothetical protein